MPQPLMKIFERNQKAIQLAKCGDVNEAGMASIFNDTRRRDGNE